MPTTGMTETTLPASLILVRRADPSFSSVATNDSVCSSRIESTFATRKLRSITASFVGSRYLLSTLSGRYLSQNLAKFARRCCHLLRGLIIHMRSTLPTVGQYRWRKSLHRRGHYGGGLRARCLGPSLDPGLPPPATILAPWP